jgi:hypothetical protein
MRLSFDDVGIGYEPYELVSILISTSIPFSDRACDYLRLPTTTCAIIISAVIEMK